MARTRAGAWIGGWLTLGAAMLAATPANARPNAGPQVVSVMDVGSSLESGEYLWDRDGVAPGPIRIVVDISRERLYVYQGGVEIGRTLIMYGADHKPTPTGSFRVLEKDIDHVSNIYGAPMPYMLRLTWTGIAIHGSGDEVDGRFATHGCVGLPDEFAALLYQVARKGDQVLVTESWMPEIYGAEA